MPPVFKTLVSIIIWVLFVVGCLSILMSMPIPVIGPWGDWRYLALGIASLFLSVVVIKMRKWLE